MHNESACCLKTEDQIACDALGLDHDFIAGELSLSPEELRDRIRAEDGLHLADREWVRIIKDLRLYDSMLYENAREYFEMNHTIGNDAMAHAFA